MQRKIVVVLTITILYLFLVSLGAMAATPSLQTQQVVIDGITVTITYGPSTIYRLAPPENKSLMWDLGYKPSGKVQVSSSTEVLRNRFVKLPSGQAAPVTFKSSDPSIVKVTEIGNLSFLAPGQATILVEVVGHTFSIPLSIIELPIRYGAKLDDVLTAHGFPDKHTKRYIAWPNSDMVDGIFYTTSGGKGTSANHLLYDRWPGVVIKLDLTDRVIDAVNVGWLDTAGLSVLVESLGKK